jgi:hypothetical protein
MRSILKATAVSLATLVALAGPASAELTGNLKDQSRYVEPGAPRDHGSIDCKISVSQSCTEHYN